MKNILLIGGSYGIGLELAKELQNENNVFVACIGGDTASDVQNFPFEKQIIFFLKIPV